MEKENKIKCNFEIKKVILTPELINKFETMENRRQIGEAHVRQIHGAILSKKNPLGVLIINERADKWRLIDGNHRLEAVKRYFGYKKDASGIECD